MDVLTPAEQAKRRGLRRMRTVAGGLLLVAAVVYVLASRAEDAGAPAWVGFVRAAAEAGMVGGLADWFAVTAIFRRPLGLPIPHTALVPTRKDQIGENLGDFVATNFLAEDVVRERIGQVDVAARVGSWLSEGANADRVAAEATTLLRAALVVLSDRDVQELLEHTVIRRLATVSMGPPAGRLLSGIVAEGAHHGLVEAVADHARDWLIRHQRDIEALVLSRAPCWSPRLVDELVAARVFAEVLRFVTAVQEQPDHPARQAVDEWLQALAQDLREDPVTMARADALVGSLLGHPSARESVAELAATVRRFALDALDDPDSELRHRVRDVLVDLGRRTTEDPVLRAKVNGWVEAVLVHVVTNYRAELATTITETVRRWDGVEAARRIELQVGRDLQFVRVNGTVVGALVGLFLHLVGVLL